MNGAQVLNQEAQITTNYKNNKKKMEKYDNARDKSMQAALCTHSTHSFLPSPSTETRSGVLYTSVLGHGRLVAPRSAVISYVGHSGPREVHVRLQVVCACRCGKPRWEPQHIFARSSFKGR